MILYMYIAPGQGQTTPWGQTFDVNRNSLSLCPFVASLKKIALKSIFSSFCMSGFFSHVYTQGRLNLKEVTSSAIVVLTAFLDSPNLLKEGLSGLKGKFSWPDA